ncbi:MAG: ATP-binding protein [Pseudoxanthomonas sp.]
MDRSISEAELRNSVIAQANMRLKVGLPLALACIGVYFFGPTETNAHNLTIFGILLLYFGYAFLTWHFSRRPGPLGHWDLAIVTALLDPLILSIWMYVSGTSSVVFVGFYLFTILGFGLRIGAVPMHLCQAMSLVGFTAVLLSSPAWRERPLFALSHLVLLVAVPLYAATLIRKLQKSKALAESESHAKSQLLAKVSHELRTPLTGIVSSAQLIEMESREAQAVSRAGSILHLAGSLDAEIRQLLDLSKLSAGADITATSSFSLAYAAEHVLRTMQPIAAGKKLGVSLEFDERITRPVHGHFQDLVSVLVNLAGNAIKFTPAGSVRLQVRLLDETADAYRVWFGVADTGIGIAPEHLDKVFEPFFQVETGANRKSGGTGLGASIARELVRKMGGELKVDSTPGKGSVFWFELPLAIDQVVARQADQAPQRPQPVVTGKRILVADDNAVNLNLIREMLARDGHRVTAAANGQEAMLKLASEDFDVLFLDFNMQDIDGATVYKTYSFSRIDAAPTFFITADTTSITTRSLEGLGVAGVLYKPITFEKLRGALAKLFADEAIPAIVADPVAARPQRGAGRLNPVPVEYIDERAIDSLREIKDSPDFLRRMVSDGMADIEALHVQLAAAIVRLDPTAVHRQAHAMKGVALSVGAVRLGALADRLMTVTHDALRGDPARWKSDLDETARHSLDALERLRRGFDRARAANH